jgi:hypothetical protein
LLLPLLQPDLASERPLQQQRVQRRMVGAAADVGPELGERVADEQEPAVDEDGARRRDARDGRDEGQRDLAHELGELG